jgi:hypothetical protein
MRRLVLIGALGAALLCTGSAVAAARSGAFGTVIRGPITPVCSAEQPCSEPAAGAVMIFSHDGSEAARVTVGPAGTYRIHLKPGLYTVRTRSRRIEPLTLRIRAGAMARADFSIDTGIR